MTPNTTPPQDPAHSRLSLAKATKDRSYRQTSREIDIDEMQFDHICPRCKFPFSCHKK